MYGVYLHGRDGRTWLRVVFCCSGVTYGVVEEPSKSGCPDGGQVYAVPLEKSTLAVEIVPGVKEFDVKLSAESLQAVVEAEGLTVEVALIPCPW